MTDGDGVKEVGGEGLGGPRHRGGPRVVAPSNRINVALPFSKLTVGESTAELAELAAIVAELADVMADLQPGPRVEEVRGRLRGLEAKLR